MCEGHRKRQNKNKYEKLVLFGWFAMSVVSLGSLLFNLPVERRKSVRELEKVSTKIIKLKCSLLFNSTCLKENHGEDTFFLSINHGEDTFLA